MGLGLKRLIELNRAALAELMWKVASDAQSLWVVDQTKDNYIEGGWDHYKLMASSGKLEKILTICWVTLIGRLGTLFKIVLNIWMLLVISPLQNCIMKCSSYVLPAYTVDCRFVGRKKPWWQFSLEVNRGGYRSQTWDVTGVAPFCPQVRARESGPQLESNQDYSLEMLSCMSCSHI